MIKYRSILSVLLALVMVLLMGFGNVAQAKRAPKPPTYTSEQIAQIQAYATELSNLRSRLSELSTLIQKQDWVFVRNFIRGPLGEIRVKMLYATQNLLPADQPAARKAAKAVFDNLIAIDQAAQDGDYKVAIRNYAETVRDLDGFLQLLPQG